MTIIQVPTNTELRSLPFARQAGYSPYRSNMDQAGRVQNIAGFGDAQTAERIHDVSIAFQYGYFDDTLNVELVGGGTLDNDKALLRATATTVGDIAHANTRQATIYQAGFDIQSMFTAAFTSYKGAAEVIQRIGCYDGDDGFVIGALNGALLIQRFKGGVLIDSVEQKDFLFDKIDGSGVSGFKINIAFLNIYRIQFGYLGILPAIFEVFGGSRLGWIPIHAIDIVNTIADTQVDNPSLPVSMHCEIVSGDPGIPIVIRTGSWFGGTVGGGRTLGDLSYFAAKNKIALPVGGMPASIIAIRNKASFRGKTNRIRLDMTYFAFSSDGSKSVTFEAYGNPVLTGAVWNDVDTNDSVVDIAVNSFTWSGGRYLGSALLDKVGNVYIQFALEEVRLNPNETIMMIAQSDNSSEVAISARWGEAR